METPTVALRFRDTTLGVDTIASHTDVIMAHGAVWWGWWKKEFEELNKNEIDSCISINGETSIYILDRSTKRMFTATCVGWTQNLSADDVLLVPDYYKKQISNVSAWFKLTSIRKVEFNETISSLFKQNTIRIVNSTGTKKQVPAEEVSDALHKSCLLHISDLHFGDDYAFLPYSEAPPIDSSRVLLSECINRDLSRIGLSDDIAAIVISGDVMSRGKYDDKVRNEAIDEIKFLTKLLSVSNEQVFIAPGNHDIVRYSNDQEPDLAEITVNKQTTSQHEREFRYFVDELLGRSYREPLDYFKRLRLKNIDLLVCILNSCRIVATKWTEYGYVGVNGLDVLSEIKNSEVSRPTFKLMALHHHLLPVADVETPNSSGVSLNLDASRILDAAQDAGIHVALHGHQHMPKLSRYESIPLMGTYRKKPLHVVSNGSTGAKYDRLPGSERNTYCLFKFDEDNVQLVMREIRPDGKEGAELFNGYLDVVPETAP